MNTRATDAVQVQAQTGDVESLHDRSVTWVSFKPIPNLVCGIDFALRKFPDLGLLSGTVQGVRHEHARRGSGDDDFTFHMNLSGLSLVTDSAARRRYVTAMQCCSAIRFRARSVALTSWITASFVFRAPRSVRLCAISTMPPSAESRAAPAC